MPPQQLELADFDGCTLRRSWTECSASDCARSLRAVATELGLSEPLQHCMACSCISGFQAGQNCAQRWNELKTALVARGALPVPSRRRRLQAPPRWSALPGGGARRGAPARGAGGGRRHAAPRSGVRRSRLRRIGRREARRRAARARRRRGGALALGPLRAALALRPQYAAAHRGLGAALLPAGAADLAEEPHLTLAREALAHTSAAALGPSTRSSICSAARSGCARGRRAQRNL